MSFSLLQLYITQLGKTMLLSLKTYIAELLGTCALIFCGTGAIVVNAESDGAVTLVAPVLGAALAIPVWKFLVSSKIQNS